MQISSPALNNVLNTFVHDCSCNGKSTGNIDNVLSLQHTINIVQNSTSAKKKKESMCSSRKYPYLPLGGVLGNSEGETGLIVENFRIFRITSGDRKSWGRGGLKIISLRGGYGYFLELHNTKQR